jgi:uncharacterized protein YggU (UPF0235/DUF167 family)
MPILKVRVTPGAKETAVGEWQGDILRLKVREKPQQGRANDAVIRLLAKSLGVPQSSVMLVRGAAAREKAFAIEGLTDDEIKRRLGAPML